MTTERSWGAPPPPSVPPPPPPPHRPRLVDTQEGSLLDPSGPIREGEGQQQQEAAAAAGGGTGNGGREPTGLATYCYLLVYV